MTAQLHEARQMSVNQQTLLLSHNQQQQGPTYQLISGRSGNDLHLGVSVLGYCCDWRCRLVGVCSLHDVGSLLSCLIWSVPKVDHILAGICEELLAKALEISVNQSQGICMQRHPLV